MINEANNNFIYTKKWPIAVADINYIDKCDEYIKYYKENQYIYIYIYAIKSRLSNNCHFVNEYFWHTIRRGLIGTIFKRSLLAQNKIEISVRKYK